MSTLTVEQRLSQLWETPKGVYGWFASVDHKDLGKRYLATAFVFLLIGGLEALLMRIQLTRANQALLTPEMYNQIFSMHGITMIFWYSSPILSGFSVYLVPLMCGARDIAFPRLNSFTYWAFLFSGILLYVGPFMGQAPDAGWFSYMPYTNIVYSPTHGIDFYALAVIFLGISTTGAAINFIVTILRFRAPGMSISKMPIFLYSTLTISCVILFAMPALTAACIFMELERRLGMHFFGVASGGNPLLWEQLFWFFGHPWVYVIFLPATGMISIIIPVFSRRTIVGYTYVVSATVLTGMVGFSVWLHHMFTSGMSNLTMSFFSAGSMTVSLFTTITIFAWLATVWKGRPVVTTAMLYAIGTAALLVIGGLNGVVTGIIPVDWQLHNTYYVNAHTHYVVAGTNVFAVFAGFYFWLPKMTGRMMSERLGKWSFWVMFIGFNITFFPMHIVGLMGMPRRIYTYSSGLGLQPMNELMTVGAFIFAIGILLSIINLFYSLRRGELAGENPWNSDGLEWNMASPPPDYEVLHIPTVSTRAPLWDDYDEKADPNDERLLSHARLTITTSLLDAIPLAAAAMPSESLVPMFLALALFGFFLALVFQLMWVCLAGLIVTFLLGCYWLWPRPIKGEL